MWRTPLNPHTKTLTQASNTLAQVLDAPALQDSVAQPSVQVLETPHTKTLTQVPVPPAQVLDAPALQDDFYLNLVDWSSQNVLAVGLGTCVYLWSACTSKASFSI